MKKQTKVWIALAGCILTLTSIASLISCSAKNIFPTYKYLDIYTTAPTDKSYGQFLKLNDNRLLYISNNTAWIFDSKTKNVDVLPGWHSAGIFVDAAQPQLTQLKDGNILVSGGHQALGINCQGTQGTYSLVNCPKGQIPLIDIASKKIRWVPFPLPWLEGHSISVLPDGNLLIVGGQNGYHFEVESEARDTYRALSIEERQQLVEGIISAKQAYKHNNLIIYNPKTYQYKILGHLQVSRQNHFVALNADKTATVFGGTSFKWGARGKEDPSLYEMSAERINLQNGQAEILGQLTFPIYNLGHTNLIKLDEHRLFFPQYRHSEQKLWSSVINIQNPEKSENWGVANWPQQETFNCVELIDRRALCNSSSTIRIVDPFKKTDFPMSTNFINAAYTLNSPIGHLYVQEEFMDKANSDQAYRNIYKLDLDLLLQDFDRYKVQR